MTDRSGPGGRPAGLLRRPEHGGPRVPAVWLVLIGIASVQAGAAIAKDLFDELSPTALVWLRLVTSALVLLAIARPRLAGRSRADWAVVIGFGVALGTMNWAIYQSFARIPLGIAVTIEFIGPLAVALFGSRRPRDLIWVLLAAAGVVLLGVEPADVTVAGVAFALLAGAAWAAYILLSAHTGSRWPGVDGLALASLVATVGLAPAALFSGEAGLLDPRLLADRRARGPAQLGGAVQLRARGAASAAPGDVRDPDEPRARGRGPGRARRARRAARAAAGARDRVRRRRQHRGHALGPDPWSGRRARLTCSSRAGLPRGRARQYVGPRRSHIRLGGSPVPQVHRSAPPPVRSVLSTVFRAMPAPLPAPVAVVVRRTAGVAVGWGRDHAQAWAEASQQGSRRNAMVAATRLARRRVEVAEVESFVSGHAAAGAGRVAHG